MNIVPIYHKKVIETFLDQFEKDMMHAQQYALINEEPVYVLFIGDQHQYKIDANVLSDPLIIRNYHSGIKIEGGTLTNRVTYNSNGSIQKSGAMHITYKNRNYKVTFYLGKGRIKVEEL
jgi:competence protein ComGD